MLVHGKMRNTAPKLEELLSWIPTSHVLLNRVIHRLLGKTVLQLKRCDWKSVHE
jgi:hypothetical protein